MLLLHISDIHFREPDCLHPDTDPERAYRRLLVQHVRQQVASLGPVGAILVGGDIAFKGDPSEYSAALAWLRELAGQSGCLMERVYVVPGNHDVDRRIIGNIPSVRNAQRAIAQAESNIRERELRTQFNDPETGRSLLLPLAAYNEFAKLFSCQVYSPDHLYWKQDVPIDGDVNLRIYGLTSVLLSGQNGHDDSPQNLYLSPLQTVLEPEDDVLNLVLVHHPPDWLMDGDSADDAFCGRAALHLFGHKHRQRITQEQNYVRFSAGAVNPDRNEPGWCPGYNLVELSVQGAGADRLVEVRSHLMQWQTNPDTFRPIKTRQNTDVFVSRLPIPSHVVIPKSNDAAPLQEPSISTMATTDVEVAMSDEPTRNLVFRFWGLTMSDRRAIAQKLNLLEAAEWGLPEPERYGRALLRAVERNLLSELTQEVASREKH